MIMLGSFLGGGGTASVSGYVIDQDASADSRKLLDSLQKKSGVLDVKTADNLDTSLQELKKKEISSSFSSFPKDMQKRSP